jgi:protein phosphatase
VTSPATPVPAPAPRKGDIVVHVFGRTDVGRTREHNEDSFVVADLTKQNATLQPEVRTHVSGERGTLFMVADGMGGAAAGEIASAMAVDIVLDELREHWNAAPAADPMSFAATLKMATEVANLRIHQFATEHPEHRGMGTTATVAGLLGDTLYLTQVGDSRAYIVRNGTARQITKDQSLMQRLIEAGEITPEEAEQNDRRNIILQALGPEPRIKIDLTHQQIRRGDVLVLCSDGLSGQVRPDEIAAIVSEETDLVAVCKRLIDRANDTGGPDNITVIAARFDGEGLQAPEDSDPVGHAVYALSDEATPTIPVERFDRARSGTPPLGADAMGPRTREAVLSVRRQRIRPYLFALAVLAVIVTAVIAWRGLRRDESPGGAQNQRPPATAPASP